MLQIRLDVDEGIILEESPAQWIVGEEEVTPLESLTLTNKRILWKYQKRTGLFKSETAVEERALTDIKYIDGRLFAGQVNRFPYGPLLQIQFKQGTEFFDFAKEKK